MIQGHQDGTGYCTMARIVRAGRRFSGIVGNRPFWAFRRPGGPPRGAANAWDAPGALLFSSAASTKQRTITPQKEKMPSITPISFTRKCSSSPPPKMARTLLISLHCCYDVCLLSTCCLWPKSETRRFVHVARELSAAEFLQALVQRRCTAHRA